MYEREHNFSDHVKICYPLFCSICKIYLKKKEEIIHFYSEEHVKKAGRVFKDSTISLEYSPEQTNGVSEKVVTLDFEQSVVSQTEPQRSAKVANEETITFMSLIKKYPSAQEELWNDVLYLISQCSTESEKQFLVENFPKRMESYFFKVIQPSEDWEVKIFTSADIPFPLPKKLSKQKFDEFLSLLSIRFLPNPKTHIETILKKQSDRLRVFPVVQKNENNERVFGHPQTTDNFHYYYKYFAKVLKNESTTSLEEKVMKEVGGEKKMYNNITTSTILL